MGNLKATAWKELVLACIGEQFSSQCSENDEITGISVSIREREDLIQIWNSNSIEADRATVIEKIKNELLPEVQFSAVFYKGNFHFYVGHKPIYDPNNFTASKKFLAPIRFDRNQVLDQTKYL